MVVGNGVGVMCVCVHLVCVLHRREPHGVLALLTHHMQDHSHQQESVFGRGGRGSEAMFAVKKKKEAFLSPQIGFINKCFWKQNPE